MLTSQQLDELVAPIALYPDPLLAQIFTASTYPLEIVQAARWLESNPNLKGEALDKAVESKDWAGPVKSLLHFPEVLKKMNTDLEWTQRLGDAVLAQQAEVMQAVQLIRAKVQQAGNLPSTSQQIVVVEKEVIKIVPADPQIIYVPQYNPQVVYVPAPQTTVVEQGVSPGAAVATGLISFGLGVAVGAAMSDDGCDWNHHNIYVGHSGWNRGDVNVNVNQNVNVNRTNISGAQSWQHDPAHRGGQPYQNPQLQQRYNPAQSAQSREQLAQQRGFGASSVQKKSPADSANRPGVNTRDMQNAGGVKQNALGNYDSGNKTLAESNRGKTSRQTPPMKSDPAPQARAGGTAPPAMRGADGSGRETRSASQRGQTSRSAGGGSQLRGGGRGR
jgi:hypothetical protein